MTFIIPNQTNTLDKRKNFGFDYSTGIKENNQIVNFADWVDDVTNPSSGKSLNVTISGGVSTENLPVDLSNLKNSNLNTVFYADFTNGLDTLSKFNVLYKGTKLTESKDAEFVSGNDRIGRSGQTSDKSQSILQLSTDTSGESGSVFTIENNHAIKIPVNGCSIFSAQGIFGDNQFSPQPLTIAVGVANNDSPGVVPFIISQSNFNIDVFDGTGQSGILLNEDSMQLIQDACIFINDRMTGDVVFGFRIKNVFHPAHRLQSNNFYSNFSYGNFNVSIRDEIIRNLTGNTVTRRVGLFDGSHGVFFQFQINTLGEARILNQNAMIYSINTTGDIDDKCFDPFYSANSKLVNSNDIPLLSLQALDPMYGLSITNDLLTIANRVCFIISELTVNTSSTNNPDSVIIKIILNAALEKAGSVPVVPSDYSQTTGLSKVGYETLSETVTGGIEIWRTVVNANNTVNFDLSILKDKILSIKYMKHYDNLLSNTYTSFYNNICIVASPRSPTSEIDTAIIIRGIEHY